MNQSQNKFNILIVGATGNLGSLITRECLKRQEFLVNTLVFDVNKDKCLCDDVEKSGGKCFQADLTEPESFRDCTKGMHTVISTVMGDNSVMIDGQLALLEDCIKNKVKRFVPSDFTFDIWGLNEGENYFIDQRLKFRKLLEDKISGTSVKNLHFTHGVFMETYFWTVEKWGFSYWGDINTKLDLTCQEDVAKFVAAAISRPDRFGDVKIIGQEVSVKQILDIYNLANGTTMETKCMGSIEDLKSKIQELKGQGDPVELVHYELLLPIYDGRGKIKNSNNSEFPEVKTTSLEGFLNAHKGKNLDYNYQIPDIVKQCGIKTG